MTTQRRSVAIRATLVLLVAAVGWPSASQAQQAAGANAAPTQAQQLLRTSTWQSQGEPLRLSLIQRRSAVAKAFGVEGLPTSFLVDARGQIVGNAVGGRDFASSHIRELIEHLIDDPTFVGYRPNYHDDRQ